MRINLQSKKLPSLIGLLILVAVLIGGVFFIKKLRGVNLKATQEISPKQVRITNISGNSFTVSWITQNKTTGLVEYGEDSSLGAMKQDIRDKDQKSSEKFQTHYINVENLKPETKYYFKIISSGASFDNSGNPYTVLTGPLKVPSDNDIAQGKIMNSNKDPESGVIVYLSLANGVAQSALTDSEGNWMIPLSTARNINLKDFANYDRSAQVEEIFVQGNSETATATLTTGSDNPAPDIILGQNYNFLNQMAQATSTPPPTIKRTFAENLSSQSSSPNGLVEEDADITITFPSENEAVNSPLPEVLGTGPKGKKLTIEMESPTKISSQTATDTKGKWKWSPSSPLSTGNHILTVYYTDSKGFLRKVVRSFKVLATGTSDLPSFTATPSGQTITPSLKPTVSPTPIRSLSVTPIPSISAAPSASPSAILSPTPKASLTVSPTPSLSLTATPTKPYRSTLPSTESGTPKPGTTLPTKLFFGVGFATILIGAALILF